LSLLLAAGCDWPGKPKLADRYVPPQQIGIEAIAESEGGDRSAEQVRTLETQAFDSLFRRNCVACHGVDGKLGPGPPLNDKLFLALVPDAELERVITEGRPGTLMPAFAEAKGGELTAEQVHVLATGLKRRWPRLEPVPSDAPPYLAPQPTKEGSRPGDPKAGLRVYARACASCHGDQGQGGDDTGHGPGVGAINDRDFLALLSDQALRRFVITGRPDLGMPDYADPHARPEGFKPLTAEEVAHLVALLASWRQGGAVNGRGN
jgi:cytochrome c oxidase cbb3-type subunit 3/ubiquinol-cytochrome c reductase cytochrome c subunit